MMFTCSDSSQQMMIDDIKKYKLDAMVVASCSPKLHELTPDFENQLWKAADKLRKS